jgi:ribosomal-protein-alanine N-acetyltransferase
MGSSVKRRQDGGVRIRRGTEADVDDFVHIWQAIWRHSFAQILAVEPTDSRFLMGMTHAQFISIARDVIVATRADRVVGFAYRNLAMIEDLWVDPAVQGHGIGRRLLSSAIHAIAADGYRTAGLDCLEANMRARRFYEREQWRPAFRYTTWSESLQRQIPRIRFEFDVWRSMGPKSAGRAAPSGSAGPPGGVTI